MELLFTPAVIGINMEQTEQQIMEHWTETDQTPKVSVICTVYNHEKYIRDTLNGFLIQQTAFPFEVLVHDDASTDNTTTIIREYAHKYPNIIIPIIQTENQYSKGNNWGHPKTINPHIRGKYVALCEGDDYWTDSNKLQKQISYMEANPDCSMTFHTVNYEVNGKVSGNDRHGNAERDFTIEDLIKGGGAFCATSSLCCRTDAYLQYPRFRTMAEIGDYPQQILMGLLGNVHYFPEIMAVYRFKASGSWTKNAYKPEGSLAMYKLAVNQTRWMTEFDCYTDHKYEDLVSDQIDAVVRDGIYQKDMEITKLEAVYCSASWRLGNFLIQPLHAVKMFVNKIKGR